ncbi:Mucin-like protein [Trichoplax sp. H2]|nr:Mucin-like protein [Trichoplax sp. H2]|eukprot:RDD40406.1 Mucin-like protein [Trichoplax sp. H2]
MPRMPNKRKLLQVLRQKIYYHPEVYPNDEYYTDWSTWSSCSTTCGHGVKFRRRSCVHPPQFQPHKYDCLGVVGEIRNCQQQPCPKKISEFTTWSTWSACNVKCGRGTQERYRKCQNFSGQTDTKKCDGASNERRNCTATKSCNATTVHSKQPSQAVCNNTCSNDIISYKRDCLDSTNGAQNRSRCLLTRKKICGLFSCQNETGCNNCVIPLNSTLITSSSYIHQSTCQPNNALLYQSPHHQSWCAAETKHQQFLQIVVPDNYIVTSVETMGKNGLFPSLSYWVETYNLAYSINGQDWRYYRDKNQDIKLFNGNSNPYEIKNNCVYQTVTAKYLRFIPKTWHRWIAMKIAVRGCTFAKT